MKFCTNCGAEIEENAKFCANCGACLEPATQSAQPVRQEAYQQPTPDIDPSDKYRGFPMKWYKFLVYFVLWLGVIINLYNGVNLITGNVFGDVSPVQVYRLFPALKAVNIIFGILVLGLAALELIAVIKLLQLASVGPKLLIMMYLSGIVLTIIRLLFMSIATDGYLSIPDFLKDPSVISGLIAAGVMTVVNWIYFKKRKSVFVN